MNQTQTSFDTMLMSYAAGSLGPYEAMIMAAHAAMRPAVRRRVTALEALCGQLVDAETPAAVSDACLNAIMARIDTIEERRATRLRETGNADDCAGLPVEKCRRGIDLGIPAPVYAVLSQACNASGWKWKRYNRDIEFIDIDLCPEKIGRKHVGQMRLLRVKAGGQTPRHRHAGTEMTLVLEGDYADETGCYGVGDLSILSEDTHFSHAPRAGVQGCLCLIFSKEEPSIFVRVLSKIL